MDGVPPKSSSEFNWHCGRMTFDLFYNTMQKFLHEVCHYSVMRLSRFMSLRAAVRPRHLCPAQVWRRGNLRLAGKIPSIAISRLRGDCFVVAMLLLATTLTACLPFDPIQATATPIPTDTAIPTATIVWFPASATPTQLAVATYTGTPEMSPGIAEVTTNDMFEDDSPWDTAKSDHGSAVISNNRLSLAVQPGYYLSSMRRELFMSDFYAEITARPSLCRGDDNYGIIVRGVGSYFYRFVLTCGGEIRAERINGGTRLPIHEQVPSGDAPRPPGEVRIGMWAVGSEMRLFLNGRFQFSVSEPTFPSGGFGVFARSAGEDPVSVTFSEFKVYDVDYVPPTRTPLPTP